MNEMNNRCEFYDFISKFFSVEDLFTLFSLLIAAFALFITYQNSKLTRKHYLATVYPKLTMDLITDEVRLSLRIILKNKGLGPAVLSGFTLEWEGERISANGLLRELQQKHYTNFSYHVHSFAGDSAMAVGEDTTVLAIEPLNTLSTENNSDINDDYTAITRDVLSKLRIKGNYCSIIEPKPETVDFGKTNV
ncbi:MULTISPECIES: hypothetical protein [Idiomarina]|jgi:hypothetical protein|uniref:hypothetical protein n=1 Tax=Idiomarina TaxID=135575 RepID=UPI00241CA17D|nr:MULTISPECIES: hypothetical protein [Idiomarina]|tara:strand:- start:5616 stop:6191 length:576 start_codon:yes stop_codon:yes gene_type:complete